MSVNDMTYLIFIGIGFILFSIMIIATYYSNKRKTSVYSFVSHKRMRDISVKKLFILWIIVQLLCILAINHPINKWYLTIGIPFIFVYGLIALYISDIRYNDVEFEIDDDEYQRYKKTIDRDNKINKLLKK